VNLAGVFLCVSGSALLLYFDATKSDSDNSTGSNPILGDVLVIAGAVLYSLSNTAQEYLLRNVAISEFLFGLGFFGTIIAGIQTAAIETKPLGNVTWTWSIVGLLSLYAVSIFVFYTVTPRVIVMTSATFFNLSVLSADFLSLIAASIVFHASVCVHCVHCQTKLTLNTKNRLLREPQKESKYRHESCEIYEMNLIMNLILNTVAVSQFATPVLASFVLVVIGLLAYNMSPPHIQPSNMEDTGNQKTDKDEEAGDLTEDRHLLGPSVQNVFDQ